jgi:hypothetical protein
MNLMIESKTLTVAELGEKVTWVPQSQPRVFGTIASFDPSAKTVTLEDVSGNAVRVPVREVRWGHLIEMNERKP